MQPFELYLVRKFQNIHLKGTIHISWKGGGGGVGAIFWGMKSSLTLRLCMIFRLCLIFFSRLPLHKFYFSRSCREGVCFGNCRTPPHLPSGSKLEFLIHHAKLKNVSGFYRSFCALKVFEAEKGKVSNYICVQRTYYLIHLHDVENRERNHQLSVTGTVSRGDPNSLDTSYIASMKIVDLCLKFALNYCRS